MLHVSYTLADRPEDAPVRVTEGCGWVNYDLSRGLFLPEGVAALNTATQAVLAGGQWFQLWRGDVVSMRSPEVRGLNRGRIHRGSLADKAS